MGGRSRVLHRAAAVALTAATLVGVASPASASSTPERGGAVATSPVVTAASATPDPDREVKFYVVKTAANGEPEFLFQLAERFLGNGNRFTEIFELNEERPQRGGRALTDPTVLEPGWVLVMPDDAQGEGIQVGRFSEVVATGTDDGADAETPEPQPDEEGADDGSEVDSPEAAGSPSPLPVILAILGGLLVVALVVAAILLLRRRSRGAEPFDDSILRSDSSAAWMVDRSLRVLLASCERDGIPVPGVVAVFVEGSGLRLRLSSPTSPAAEPWVASDDGQSWAAPLAKLQREPADEGSTERFARLVTLGSAQSGRVLVDIAKARGVISLGGPIRARHEVLRRWLGELTGNPWSDHPRVVMIGNGLPEPESVERLGALEQLLPELETESRGVLVLSQTPSSSQLAHLSARFASPRFGWSVIVLDDMSSARWRFSVDDDGWLRSGFLPDIRLPERTTATRGG